jgi:hypothetical protein
MYPRASVFGNSVLRRLFAVFTTLLAISPAVLAGPASPPLQTGVQVSIEPGDDGSYLAGRPLTVDRFLDRGNGTILDQMTNLVWLKDAGCLGGADWNSALVAVANMAHGLCSLEDGSVPGEWRLPNIVELMSIVDYGNVSPALAPNHPFIKVQSAFYWSSSTLNNVLDRARPVDFASGRVDSNQGYKSSLHFVWPVRDLR